MFYHDRIETNLLRPFAHPENSDWFSIIFLISEVNIVAEQKQVLSSSWLLNMKRLVTLK